MLTKWYKLVLRGTLLTESVSGLKNVSGNTFTYYGNNYCYQSQFKLSLGNAMTRARGEDGLSASNGGPVVSFGSGNTAPTENDYTLENFLTGVSYSVDSVVKKYGDKQDVISNTIMITNNNEEEITVSEVGIFTTVPYSSGNSNNYYYTMMERTVLTNPLTIPAGEAASFKYEIVINYPE